MTATPSEVEVSGRRVRELRKANGLTQETLARLAIVSRSYLAEIELGSKAPKELVARSIAKALGVDFQEILRN